MPSHGPAQQTFGPLPSVGFPVALDHAINAETSHNAQQDGQLISLAFDHLQNGCATCWA